MSLKRKILQKFGYRKIESQHKILDAFAAQKSVLGTIQKPTIFDVGANIGQTATHYRSFFPQAAIHCFEPVEESFRALISQHQNDQNIHAYSLALANKNEKRSFYINKKSENSSLLVSEKKATEWSPPGSTELYKAVTLQTETLDNFCQSKNISYIDILKIDIQGAELQLLEGASHLLKHKKIHLIYAEVLFVPLYEKQAYFHDIASHLHQYNYSLFDIFNFRYADSGQIKWADALFISPTIPRNKK